MASIINRHITSSLVEWSHRERKPLLLRGARQVGKTFAIRTFAASNFKTLVELNLEKRAHRDLFFEVSSADALLKRISISLQVDIIPGEALIFIDEIQASEEAITQLRFLYEEIPELHVIAAGSLLEVRLQEKSISIPVGRVEYLYMVPVSWQEYLEATNNDRLSSYLNSLGVNDQVDKQIHRTTMAHFYNYLRVGGMPEVVASFLNDSSMEVCMRIYESLITGFQDDVLKYAKRSSIDVLQFLIEVAPRFAGAQINYEKMGAGRFKSREISAALSLLEGALLLKRVRPFSSLQPPLTPNLRASPKLLFLDVGLVNYAVHLFPDYARNESIISLHKGQISEQVVGQILQALNPGQPLYYWKRTKAGASAEVDYLIQINGQLVPIEVKSGATGRLSSLFEIIDTTGARVGLRVYSGEFTKEQVTTLKGNQFTLLSIPFYLCHRIYELIPFT